MFAGAGVSLWRLGICSCGVWSSIELANSEQVQVLVLMNLSKVAEWVLQICVTCDTGAETLILLLHIHCPWKLFIFLVLLFPTTEALVPCYM